MHRIIIPILFILVAGLGSCKQSWDDHYHKEEPTANQTLWETITAIPEFSVFANYLAQYKLDTVLDEGNSMTLFIPTNEAFESFNPDTGDITSILRFHMMDYVFNTIIVNGTKLAETSGGKFVPVEFIDGTYKYNGVNITYFSPLYKDGRYYTIDEVAIPKPNLYEYIAQTALPLKTFIDDYDSIILDYELSKPLGFDEFGNVIYDSVYSVVNFFDTIYFAVKQEDRYKTATFITFSEEQYINALDLMAADLTGDYNSAEDIPQSWQDEVFLTDMVNKGLFQNSLQYEDLLVGRLKNVRGDTVEINPYNIDPDSRTLASNGVLYEYIDFRVPDYLYRKEIKIEGEHMVDSASGFYIWKENVTIRGSEDAKAVFPRKFGLPEGVASNDSSINVQFPKFNYTGEYEVEFFFENMFPMRYLFVWAASYNPSGVYQIFINDEMIKEFDTFLLRQTVWSEQGGVYYFPRGGYNLVDAWVDNITDFGDIKITLKYIGPSEDNRTNGFNIDYISLIPQF